MNKNHFIIFLQSITYIPPSYWNVGKSALFMLLWFPPRWYACPQSSVNSYHHKNILCYSPHSPFRFVISAVSVLSTYYPVCRELPQISANFITYTPILSLLSLWKYLAWETSPSCSPLKASGTCGILSVELGCSLNSNFQPPDAVWVYPCPAHSLKTAIRKKCWATLGLTVFVSFA